MIKEQVILDVLVICRLAFYFTLFLDYSLNLAPGSITTTSILFISEVTFGISTYAILFFIQTVIAVPFGAYWRLTFCALGTYQHIFFFFFCYIFFYLSFFYCDFTLGLFNEIVHRSHNYKLSFSKRRRNVYQNHTSCCHESATRFIGLCVFAPLAYSA